jgi:hypothetical protein
MTAEIAVLNRTAVALAADSASTSLQATGLPKIFNTADKLFHLDAVSPIGIMVYGNATFMGIPWETVIKRYRELATSYPPTLAQGAEDFLSFLASAQLLTDAHIRRWFELHISELAAEADRYFRSEVQKRGPPATVAQICAELAATIGALPLLPATTQADVDDFVNQWNAVLDNAINVAFANNPLAAPQQQALKTIIARANLTLPREQDSVVSGIAIAGFGEQEFFPVLWNCHVRSVLLNRRLQRTAPQCEPLTMPMTAMIRAFAQGEMVYSFLHGIDPLLRETVERSMGDLLGRFCDQLAALTGFAGGQLNAFRNGAAAVATAVNQNFRDAIERYCRERHVDPVLTAIGLLPKDQLAVMAETLVSLTSFKRKMSRDAETVGGDVDVAVISKGDGFVWVKRKHYFPPELNVRYIERIKEQL